MSKAIENLQAAQQRAMSIRPKVGGFPYLAEALRQAGVTRNFWSLPSCQSLFLTNAGSVVMQGASLVTGMTDVPAFDQGALIKALTNRPSGKEHLSRVPCRFVAGGRCPLRGRFLRSHGRLLWVQWQEQYVESYPAVELSRLAAPRTCVS